MHRLLYISTARTTPDRASLDAILRVSRRNNAAAGITGLLIVGGKRFLQTLEGPAEAVFETFDRIRRDPAHFAVVELARGPIEKRAFPEWSMGYQIGGAAGDTVSVPAAIGAVIAPIEDATLRAYFSGFAEMHAAA
ncbi:MAG: BLUF domain-containing protein [Sphingomonas sp.]|jgi:hypothetical protein|uniref:BLUF domain-containing protein n=1 Tax=Sphingomonas sp. TaxID=28214 RepID=UPI00356A4683